MTRTTVALASLLFLVAGPSLAAAPPAADPNVAPDAKPPFVHDSAAEAAKGPPFDLKDPARIQAGKTRFNSMCAAYCHGHEGDGGRTPAFKGRKDLTPTLVYRTISDGRRGSDIMPSWGHGFTPEKIWELTAYIMSLTRMPPPPDQ